MVYELSISSDYRPEWGVWEGLREILQNMYDAGEELGGETAHWHDGKAGHFACLAGRLESTDLLLGETSKSDNPELIGQFGDGMKIGAIALLRKGHKLTMTQAGERWHFSLKDSRRFAGRQTLHVDVRKHAQEVPQGTQFTVQGLGVADYNKALQRFLPSDRGVARIVPQGKPGDIYVKGVYVTSMEDYKYAYNLPNARLGPDRSILDAQFLGGDRFYAFLNSLTLGELPYEEALSFLESGTRDADFDDYFGHGLPISFDQYLRKEFKERYGEKTFPAFNDEDAKQLQFAGYSVMRPATRFLQAACYCALGTSINELIEKAGISSKPDGELTEAEQEVLDEAKELLDLANTSCDIQVVEFADVRIHGAYINRHIELARKQLHSLPETLATLLHEKAHWMSGDADGTPGFQNAVYQETIKLLRKLLCQTGQQ